MLAATRAENVALAETYSESEAILAGSRSLSPVQKKKISASSSSSSSSSSSYDEEVEEVEDAVGKTKKRIKAKLPDKAANLQAWVDEQWQQEVGEANTDAARMTAASTSSGRMTFKVYTTQYWGYTNYEMALPHRKLKFAGATRPSSPMAGARPASR